MDRHQLNGEIPSIPSGVTLTTLDNGLVIIVREDHSAPVVSAQAWCMTGSVHEGKWLGAGLSHVLEHMLFKGTATRPGSRIDQEVQEAGGYMNAYTSFDRTVYHIDVPSSGATVVIDILCDIMQNASLPPDELAKEMDVIRREMDMGYDDPGRRASRRLFETAYTRSPYRFTVIGYPDIFNEVKPADIRSYYEEKYAPNNVFFVVVGDVKNADVVAQIRTAYGKTRAKPLPPVVLSMEPHQTAPRLVVEEAPIELGHCHFAWHIPDIRDPDVPVLDVLSVVLGHGRSSRLYREVREKQGVVHHVDSWTYSPGNPGLFGMSAIVDGDRFESAREAMLAEIEKLQTTPVTALELGKAVKQFVSGTLATRKTMQGQAQDLGGSWLAANDLNFSERYLAAVRRVTPDHVMRVARQYLTPENRTVFALVPTGTAPAVPFVSVSNGDNAIQKVELPNGLRLLIKEDRRLPFVEFRAVFQGGVLTESTADNGISQLTTRMLLKGTDRRSAEQIATEIESVGGNIDCYAGNNSLGVNMEVLSSDFDAGLDVIADALLHSTFPAEPLEREREVQLANLQAQKDHLLKSASVAMRRALFGDAGYGLDSLGREEIVQRITPENLRDYYRRFVTPDNCVLAVFGDAHAGRIRESIEKAFGQWKPSGAPPRHRAKSVAEFRPMESRVSEVRDKKQSVLVMGFPATTLYDDDRYALELIQESCSDLGSRLFLRIRDELGLAYYVGAQHFPGLIPGFFSFYLGTMPEKVDIVEQELLREAELLCTEGLTAAELQRAKAKIIGQKKIARQDLGTVAMTAALDELYGLGYAHWEHEDALYERVTEDEVRSVAQKYLKPELAALAIVGGIKEGLVAS